MKEEANKMRTEEEAEAELMDLVALHTIIDNALHACVPTRCCELDVLLRV